MTTLLNSYMSKNQGKQLDTAAVAFYSSIDHIATVSPSTANSILKEFYDQSSNLKLIASENFSSQAVQFAMGNLLTDKYAEGFPYHRFYAGCDNVDAIESEAAQLACELFGAEHAYVQPHSGADANMVAFISILSAKVQKPILEDFNEKNPAKLSAKDWAEVRSKFLNQKLLAMDYYSGGHLTHGYRHNFSGLMFDAYNYTVEPDTKLIDYDQLSEQLHELRPLIFLAGYSAYPRKLNFAKMRELADEVGAVFMVDMSHFAGLVAGKVFTGDYNPVPHAHVVTSTTHKTLRGPRGGIVLCKKEFAEYVDKGCPAILGGPLPNVMAAKVIAFKEALSDDFKNYAKRIVENSNALAEACLSQSLDVLTGGTDNHLLLIDVSSLGLTGRQAESALRECNFTLNRNSLPFDKNGPWYTSGLRVGTPALTTLGMGPDEMNEIAKIMKYVLSNTTPFINTEGEKAGQKNLAKYVLSEDVKENARGLVGDLLKKFPLYPNLDMDIIRENIK